MTFHRSLAAQLLGRFRQEIAWVLLFSLLVNLLTLTPTLYMMQIYDRILIGQSMTSLLVISLTVVGLLLLMSYTDTLRSKILIALGSKIEVTLSDPLFANSLQHYLKDKATEPSEYLRALVEFKQFVAGMALVYLFDVLWSPVYIFIAFLLHPLLGALSLGIIALQLCLLWLNHRLNAPLARQQQTLAAQQQHFVHANLRSLLPMFAMGYAERFKQRWLQWQQTVATASEAARQRSQTMQSVIRFFRYAVQSLSLGGGAYLAIHGQLSIGSMIAANVIVAKALAPFDQMTQLWPQWVAFARANQQLSGLFTEQASVDQPRLPAVESINQLALRQFTAGYQPQAWVVQGIDLQLQAGEVVAVMGPSGSGKTTLAKSLLGLANHTQGEVLLNGMVVDYAALGLMDWRVGYLPQDFQLFEGTVAENIARFAALDSAAITQAAMLAGIHDWVLRLPRGYDTMIGFQGQVLSGGQKQQLGLARALYGNPSLVVLDEPNSNLDDSGERALNQSLLQMKQQQKIVVVVSHREQVLAVADKILWLAQGKRVAFDARDKVFAAMQVQGE